MANLSPQEIVKLVKSGKGPEGMYRGGDQSATLAAQHEEIAGRMQQLQSSMNEYWQGDAAGQAYAGAGPMVQASQTSGQHLAQARSLYQGQGSSFSSLHSSVSGVGDLGDKPGNDWVSDTPLSFLSNRADEIDAWNKKAQIVTDSYNNYHSQSSDNSSRWADPSQYGELALPSAGGDFTVTQPNSPGGGHLPAHYTPGGPGGGSSPGDGYSGSGSGNGGSGSSSGGGNTGGGTGHSNGHTGPTGVTPPSDTHPWGPPVPSHPTPGSPDSPGHRSGGSDGTDTSGYVPPDPTAKPPVSTWTPTTGTGPNPATGGGNSPYAPGVPGPFGIGGGGGSSDFSGGRGGAFGGTSGGSGTSGPGAGGGSGNSVGRGAGTGTGSFGSSEAVAGKGGAAGAAGRAGSPGMGGAMGHGKKGEGEDDLVHETADYLVEQDPDAALIGELPKSVPPVIGL